MFNCKVLQTNAGDIVFTKDQLVQVYDNFLDMTLSMAHKLLPQWSAPCCIIQHAGNSYTLKTLAGFPVPGWFHARCLHEFISHLSTNLAIEEEERGGGKRSREEGWDWEDGLEENKAEDKDTGSEGDEDEWLWAERGRWYRWQGLDHSAVNLGVCILRMEQMERSSPQGHVATGPRAAEGQG